MTPFRILQRLGYAVVWVLILIAYPLLNATLWVVGWGFNGYYPRQESAAHTAAYVEKHLVFDFGSRMYATWGLCELSLDHQPYSDDLTERPRFMIIHSNTDWSDRKRLRILHSIETANVNMIQLQQAISALKPGPNTLNPCEGDVHIKELNLTGAPNIIVAPDLSSMCTAKPGDDPDHSLCRSHLDDVELKMYVTWYDDLFSSVPPISRQQMAVEHDLYATGTQEFWLKIAHQNGIHNDAKLLGYWAKQDRTPPKWTAN